MLERLVMRFLDPNGTDNLHTKLFRRTLKTKYLIYTYILFDLVTNKIPYQVSLCLEIDYLDGCVFFLAEKLYFV